MHTLIDLPVELQGTVTEKVWDVTGKEVGLIKGVEPVKVQIKPNAVFPQVSQYHMTQDVLIEVHGDANRPVAYFSATLDPVAAALPGCLRAVAAVGQSLLQCEGIVMGYPLTVMVPHSVEILLTRTKTQHMTNARLTRYETIILGSPNVTLKRCTVLNPATLLPNENVEIKDGEEFEHDCLEVTELCTKPRPDIQDTQLKENDCIMFVDGSCLRDSAGTLRAGYAVEANTLPPIGDPGHCLQAGDWVVVKKHVRKSCLEPRWKGPYQVILTTTTAVKCARVPNWIHASHTKKVTCPVEEELEVSGAATSGREVSESENSQEGTETTGEPTENSLVPQAINEFERGDRVPISVEAAGELSQGEVLPEVDEYGLESEPNIEPEEEREEETIDTNQNVSESPEPVAGPSKENTISQEEGAVQRPEGKHREKTNRGDNWPDKSHPKIREVSNDTIIEESDTSQADDLSEGEQQGEQRLKRKRIANRRYTGPEWAYATTSEWQQEFLAFCLDREVPGQYYGT
ncbi:hypothetical protein NDU88_008765 [Pleurodeles waltl]|uniref:Murine leukemia virus integrase C-terminal domain-containing protein n=1 Tax=Pleurodeles waltl TaxID=8319 RepID=A0AAV7RX19_PLEWA|nr:hypothetical protein NDU88_008765 [Pleurodeles waltl]